MRVTVVRGAGLTGMVRLSELDADTLPAEEQETLRGLVDHSGLVAAPAEGPPPQHADEQAYEIQVAAGEGEPVVARFGESSLPDGARKLMAWVAEHPATRSRLAPPGR
ncbi:MAG: protealysin inhibitor emfourin [Solirubrobacteraceae bacterium]